MNYKLDTMPGDDFHSVAKKAKEIAYQQSTTVEFDFNGITCLVDSPTDLELLWRDYHNAHIMEWKTVGPVPLLEYDAETKAELEKRERAREERQATAQAEYEEKERQKKAAFEEVTAGITIDLVDEKAWNEGKENNQDPYGGAIFIFAEAWAKLMQAEIAKGSTVAACAEHTSFAADFVGLTGFMYGAAVSILGQCWKHGEELRVWHNSQYGHSGSGTVNPAILNIKA